MKQNLKYRDMITEIHLTWSVGECSDKTTFNYKGHLKESDQLASLLYILLTKSAIKTLFEAQVKELLNLTKITESK